MCQRHEAAIFRATDMETERGIAIVLWTVRLALACYLSAAVTGDFGRADGVWASRARLIWTAGALLLAAHMVAAYGVFHHWSHAEALRHTARQTAAVTGLDWGGGLYFNFALAALWLADAAWWWRDREGYRTRGVGINASLHAFFVFMIFNATVVFGSGPIRLLGLVGTAAVLLASFVAARQPSAHSSRPQSN